MKIIVKTKQELKSIISGSKADANLNHLDVTAVTDMTRMFICSEFNGDISQWDVSNVTDMSYMFLCSEFNGDISNWDTSKVIDVTRTLP